VKDFLATVLDRRSTVRVAAGISLTLGLFFTFVWAPHPWGWQGIDQYHELASALARGEPFGTTDVPWGYAYFAAVFYRLFGEHVVVPVTAQVIINGAAPVLLYHLTRQFTTQRVAVLASLLTGVFSFNNVYASTQASDALCTVLFLASLLALARAMATGRWWLFALSGLLSGSVAQFRPNMVLFPAVVAALYVLHHRSARHLLQMIVFSALVVAALAPWIYRNYHLTGLFMPTSTHGGVQLWYGTLQVGPYLESRAHNPRSIFESAPQPYTSLNHVPLIVSVEGLTCDVQPPSLVYWTDRDERRTAVSPDVAEAPTYQYSLPPQTLGTTLYFYFRGGDEHDPYIWLVSDTHLYDMDRNGDLLDVFDLIALVRRLAWDESASARRLDFDGDGAVSQADLERAITWLIGDARTAVLPITLAADRDRATLTLVDGSTVVFPATWSGKYTDLDVRGSLAGALISRWRTMTSLTAIPETARPRCQRPERVTVNGVFYRREPHQMRRYMALAFDNISRDPWGFAAASAYRMVRLFIIRGSDDRATAQQFSASRLAYTAGTILSAAYFAVFLWGAWIAWRQRSALLVFLIPIVYVPLTICFVLTNMRYTVTMQPLMFVFVAVAILEGMGVTASSSQSPGKRDASHG
jgi:hypothetical protein